MTNPNTNQGGFLLVSLLVVTFFIVAAALVTSQLALSNLRSSTVEYNRLNAQFAADAAIDQGIYQLNQNQDWLGNTEAILYEDSTSKTTYQTEVIDDSDPFVKYLSVTGRTYSPKDSPEPRVERKYEVKLRGVGGGSFSVVTGVGGLIMSNNSKIVGGNVFVNGEIRMSNSSQIGLTTSPVDVKAAHQNCPVSPNATYPRVCTPGENGQPITLNNSAKIYGEVQATNQTNGDAMFNPGLVAGNPAPGSLPEHDRAAQVAAVTTEQTGNQAGCSSGTKTWPANLKINGNVSISNTCRVTVEGNIWITGSLNISNSAQLIVSNALASAPAVMIDGSNGLTLSNSSILRSNTQATPVGFRVVTYWSTASCSPGCSNVTGTDLYNSRNQATINISNSASGPQTEFYARWSRVSVNNGGNVGALVGQTVELSNSGTITFGTSVTGVGGVSAWIVDSYKRTF